MKEKKKKSKSKEKLHGKLNAPKKKKLAPKVIKKAAPKVEKQKRYHCSKCKGKSYISHDSHKHYKSTLGVECKGKEVECRGNDCGICKDEGKSLIFKIALSSKSHFL